MALAMRRVGVQTGLDDDGGAAPLSTLVPRKAMFLSSSGILPASGSGRQFLDWE